MEVRKVIKTNTGNVLFEGELNQEEADFVLGIGLNVLLEQGAIPFTAQEIPPVAGDLSNLQ